MKSINVKQITNLHNDALRGLDFYAQELTILQERLEEIAADNTGKEVLEKVEHFQNQFIIHRQQIDDLRHYLHANLKTIEVQITENTGFVTESSLDKNKNLYEQYVTEENIFNEMHHEFNRFAAEWM
ncbi:hypothetical protein [Mucilaginibacter xinganensis]|uniref:DUF2383 domain-containing protein n=1 Tax=Mucilaginibacter xinganensis TaxID=1234841 RepID=A0A223NY22_9SPHI|nr:hypothetical protein [Mucilaginibacter xinganensis]ASU34767.1 hypothetical protein MuYL_2880 [Mucilaginibacter xinganensis]